MKDEKLKFYFKLVFYIGILILSLGCGKKGPPVPWDLVVPKRIMNLEAKPRDGKILLEWTSPKENTDKSPLTDLVGFRILRSEGILIDGACRGCSEKAVVIKEIKLDMEKEKRGKRMTIFINGHEPKKVYIYQVVSVNRRGYLSSPSNPVTIFWDNPPDPPKGIKVDAGDKRVDLFWETVEGATGYNVYRRGEDEKFSNHPINSDPILKAQYTDLNVENEKRYFYLVRAVKRFFKTDLEGESSEEISVVPKDLTPPSAPKGLVAIPIKNGIELNWRKNEEPDLLGYYVYRRKSDEREFWKLNQIPIEKETYLDTAVEIEQDYVYVVTAVDNSPQRNESLFSEEVTIKYRY